MIGSAFAKAKRSYNSNPCFRNRVSYQSWQRLFPGDRAILFWEQFTQSVIEAEKMARPEDFDYLGLLIVGRSLSAAK